MTFLSDSWEGGIVLSIRFMSLASSVQYVTCSDPVRRACAQSHHGRRPCFANEKAAKSCQLCAILHMLKPDQMAQVPSHMRGKHVLLGWLSELTHHRLCKSLSKIIPCDVTGLQSTWLPSSYAQKVCASQMPSVCYAVSFQSIFQKVLPRISENRVHMFCGT